MLEIIATTLDDAIRIEACGADRIELVSALSEGGLTPSYGLIQAVIKSVNIPVNVMIRPHHQSFIYSDAEIDLMINDIRLAEELGANGVVLGVLTNEKQVDLVKLERLLTVCSNLDVTFHRAIDECQDILAATKRLAEHTDIKRILTSGGPGRAIDHLSIIKAMNEVMLNNNKYILAGSGINLENLCTIISETGVKECHLGTDVRVNKSCFEGIDRDRLRAVVSEYN